MARKTNKTAHVLNLISKAKDEHQSAEDQVQIDNTGSDVSNDLLFMGIEPSNDKSISEKIAENLETLAEQMEEGDVPQEIASVQAQAATEAPPQENAFETEDIPKEVPFVAEATPEAPLAEQVPPQPTVQQTQPTQEKTLPPTTSPKAAEPILTPEALEEQKMEEEIKKTFHYVNVYEKLVLERLEEFQDMFEVCTCPRCTADVIALALTHLPAKYIVIDDPKVIPLLSFYRAQLKTPVTTQLSSACVTVKEKPLHHT